ncbi:hypothetical protein D9M72_573930 [compost metagenome]
MSRSEVEYRPSNTLPMVLRMMSCGILARFSAQSVSMMPVSGESCTSRKPLSCQKPRSCCHSWSPRMPLLITSQRVLPSRSMRMPCAEGSTFSVGDCSRTLVAWL